MIFRLQKHLTIKFPIGKILFSIIIGTFIALYFTQQQPIFKRIVKNFIIPKAEEMLGCSVDCDIKHLNFFNPNFTLENIVCNPNSNSNKTWSWKCNKLNFKFSWLNLMLLGKIDANITINKIHLESLYQNNQLDISNHLYTLLIEPSDIPFEIKELKINTGIFDIYNQNKSTKSQLVWSSKSKEFRNTLNSRVYLKNGYLKENQNTYLNQISGHIQISIPMDGNLQKINGESNINFFAPYIDASDKYFISAKWGNGFGMCKANSIKGTVDLSPISLQIKNDNQLNINSKGYLSLALIQKFMPNKLLQTIDGNCFMRANSSISKNAYTINGSCSIENLSLDSNIIVDIAKLSFNRNKSANWNGKLKLAKDKNFDINGNWKWQEDKKNGSFELSNSNKISLPIGRAWFIKPKKLYAKFNLDPSSISGIYTATCSNSKLDTKKEISGSIKYIDSKITVNGKIDQDHYHALISSSSPYIQNLTIKSENKNSVISVEQDSNHKFVKSILDIELFNKWLPRSIQNIISGQGKLEIDSILNKDKLSNKIQLIDSNLVIPKIYNIIKNLDGNVILDMKTNSIRVDNAILKMHKGEVNVNHATISPEFIYIPCLLNNCAINFEKNLITNISGKLLYQKQSTQKPKLKGLVVLEQTLCKYNLLSEDIQNFFSANQIPHATTEINPNLDINIITRSPIKIRSEFLETNAIVDIHIANNWNHPLVTGHIKISGGKINFPSKPLYITKGSLYFTAEQPNQPMIDLVAKSQIKRHNITMHISGSINNPYIILESSPTLTEEQIGALLLTGSENTTLNMIMPAIIMQNLNSIVFGSIYDEEKNSNLKKLLKPLDHVKFIPSFSDETGRGGLKGAVEIDVNDRLRALIQKNFSLSEDTKVEIDYALTDDVSIRGIKDERGDLGGEIEIRWRV